MTRFVLVVAGLVVAIGLVVLAGVMVTGGLDSPAAPPEGDAAGNVVRDEEGRAPALPDRPAAPAPADPGADPAPEPEPVRIDPDTARFHVERTVVTIEKKNGSARELFETIAKRAGLALEVTPGAARALGEKLSVSLVDTSAESVLDLLCARTGTCYEYTKDGRLRISLEE